MASSIPGMICPIFSSIASPSPLASLLSKTQPFSAKRPTKWTFSVLKRKKLKTWTKVLLRWKDVNMFCFIQISSFCVRCVTRVSIYMHHFDSFCHLCEDAQSQLWHDSVPNWLSHLCMKCTPSPGLRSDLIRTSSPRNSSQKSQSEYSI